MKKQALVVLADGFELIEAMTVVDALKRAGIGVTTLGLNALEVRSHSDVYVRADALFSEGIAPPDAVIIPGGKAVSILARHEGVLSLIRRAYEKGAVLGAICAGPIVLEAAGVLAGHVGTSYPDLDAPLSYREWVDQPVVTDGLLITSQGPATTVAFALALIAALTSPRIERAVADALLETRWGQGAPDA